MLSNLHKIISKLTSPLCMMSWLACLLRHWRSIRDADVIVQADRPHAFGTTLNIIEVARRLHPNKRIVVFVFREPQNHNPKLGYIFGDLITFVSWPRPNLRFEFLGRSVIIPPRETHDPIAFRMSHWWFRWFAKSDAVHYSQPELYAAIPHDEGFMDIVPKNSEGMPEINGFTMDSLFSRYFNAVPAPPYQLDERIQSEIDTKLLGAAGALPSAGWCGVHLKKDEGVDAYKDGSPVDAYLPAMRKIVEAGYQILVKGDRKLPLEFLAELKGKVFDATSLGVDPDLFNLYVITKSTIFVGDSGPGTWMAGARDIPSLALNVFPIGLGFSITWIYFKSCVDAKGQKASPDILFGEIANRAPPPEGWSEATLTEAEITEAVDQFLQQPEPRQGIDAYNELVSQLPVWSCFRAVGVSHLSPAWVRRNSPENSEDPVLSGVDKEIIR